MDTSPVSASWLYHLLAPGSPFSSVELGFTYSPNILLTPCSASDALVGTEDVTVDNVPAAIGLPLQ